MAPIRSDLIHIYIHIHMTYIQMPDGHLVTIDEYRQLVSERQ